MGVKNNTIIYVPRASNSKRDCEHDRYCCLLLRCEALRTYRSGFPIATPSVVQPLQAKPKEMMRAEPKNNRTAGIDIYHSTMFTLLLDLNVISEQKWIQFEPQNSPSRVFAFDGKIYTAI